MGNIACVPQAPGGFRHSFRRKPSLKKEQNGKKKLPSFFGIDGDGERDTTTDKILQYIPGKSIQSPENQKENLDQRFPSLFKKGRRKTVVRNLGKIIYYSKVKFRFQHCQEVNDCYLELFQSHLYFQSMGSNGLTYQGLLPLKELNVWRKSVGQEEQHAFCIAGSLLNPLIVFCSTEPELKQWLYHLEKQIHLNGGSLGLPLVAQDDWKQSSVGKEELRWSVQNMPVQEWRGTQRESLGDVLCVSKVKLQHLPFQEQHERLLVLYPSTLVIVSEEPNGLYFKGELPLNAIQVLFEENEKTSFLIEGRLINSIRVICRSYEDYQEWLYCLKTAQFRNADSSLSGSESFSGSKLPHLSQFAGSGRGSLASDGRTNSWASGGKGTNTLTHLSQHSGSLHDAQSFMLLEEQHSPGYSQPLHCLPHANWPSTVVPVQELRRGSSTKKPKGRCGPGTQDVEQAPCSLLPQHPVLPALYSEPYCTYSTPHRPTDPPAQLELSNVLQCQKIAQPLPGRHWMEVLGAQRHPQPPADAPYLASVSSLPEEHLGPLLQPPDDGIGAYDVPEGGCLHRDSTVYHDYAELQSFQSELSYDNLWDAEGREPDSPASFYEV
ncbi:pleckstrin homology domain-containing family N member 1 [Gallus gallus]|uniref:Pleckstrin homology domain containing N1 n=1 Tax=Gallus gallus TaxID=9031 RepID=A0A8V0ZMN5_CHICK|nr:pleckstrin homology domain-containing family N member 1 [Gallus gallus]XP_040545034.1 pleckstrin homology domain-containing family N member 1 [Gallus gallus]